MEKLDCDSKILVPKYKYDINNDERFLIPFVQGTQIGFANKEGKIIIPPKFQFVLDDFDYENSLVRVGETYAVAYERKTMPPTTYIRKRYGILKSNGEFLVPVEYEGIAREDVFVLRSMSKGYSVINKKGKTIVPFGKFCYIDGFNYGHARVRMSNENKENESKSNWGIINDEGKIVLEPKYKYIYDFKNDHSLYFTKVVGNNGMNYEFHYLEDKLKENGSFERMVRETEDYESLQEYMYNQTYDEYNGNYTQDVMGYSDQEIDDAFDGDPDAYWNID